MPSIVNGLFSGRAGIQAHGTAIAVLADNIANANTVAFKASRPEFSDLVAGNLSGGGSAITLGSGSQITNVTEVFTQGTFEFTGRGLDVAIDGNGFFVVEKEGSRFYSRAGNFKIDEEGNLLNQNGLEVLGFPANGSGGLESINVTEVTQSDVETENVSFSGNLNASDPNTTLPLGGETFAQLSALANYSTFVDVFDTLGGKHTVNVYFFKTATNTWVARSYVDGGELAGGTPGQAVQMTGGNAAMAFNSSGTRVAIPASDMTVTPPGGGWATGAASSAIDISFNPFTQYSSASTINSITQDGKGGGNVVSFNIEGDGSLFAVLDNGQTSNVGTIALVTFSNPEGLRRNGDSLYTKSTASGEPVVGTPGTGQFGALESGAIELSTSDVAADFIKLISLQRGFQSSSRVITTIDDLLTEIVNLAR